MSGLYGTITTTTSADGRTVTERTKGTRKLPSGKEFDRTETTVRVYDAGHNRVSIVSDSTDTVSAKKGERSPGDSTRTFSSVRKYNEAGGYSQTIDDSYVVDNQDGWPTVTKKHIEVQCDADGNTVSGTETLTQENAHEGNGTTKSHFDSAAGRWVIDEEPAPTPAQPDRKGISTPNEQIVAPPISDPAAQIMVTYRDPEHPDHSPFYVAEQKRDGSTSYLRGSTDDEHHLFLTVAADAVAVSIFKGFDGAGRPDAHAVTCTVSSDAPVPGMQSTHVSTANQPAIVAASTAYDLRAGTLTVQTQHTSDVDSLELDGATLLPTLAMSDRSIVAAIPSDTDVGRHGLSLASELRAVDTAAQTALPIDVVTLVVEPMARVENVGDTATPTIRVIGLAAGDTAVMDFAIGGSAELMQGGTTTTVPVVGNVATCTIRGVRQGEALVRFHLRVVNLAQTAI